jgi:hypothetical protein
VDLAAAFRARLLANSTIATLTGGKIAWDERTGMPAIVLTKVGPGRSWTHDGPNDLIQPRVQVDCYGGTRAEAQNIANAVQAEMERLDSTTAGGWTFMPPGELNVDLSREPDDLPGGGKAYLVTQDYTFWAQPAE